MDNVNFLQYLKSKIIRDYSGKDMMVFMDDIWDSYIYIINSIIHQVIYLLSHQVVLFIKIIE